MARRWYVVTPEHGIEFFDTEDAEDAAKTYAHEAMKSWRSEASDGGEWIEEIGELEWGEVICHGRAVRTECEPDPSGKYDTIEDWELLQVVLTNEKEGMMSELLPCPACGEPCRTLPPHRPTMYCRHPWWEDGEYATCQCGAEVIVDAEDGTAAWLELRVEA